MHGGRLENPNGIDKRDSDWTIARGSACVLASSCCCSSQWPSVFLVRPTAFQPVERSNGSSVPSLKTSRLKIELHRRTVSYISPAQTSENNVALLDVDHRPRLEWFRGRDRFAGEAGNGTIFSAAAAAASARAKGIAIAIGRTSKEASRRKRQRDRLRGAGY